MLSEFEKKVADFIKANKLFGSADKVLLAVSGGADSTALLYAISSLRRKDIFTAELLCAHINHQLRPIEADSDEDFIIEQAAMLKLAISTRRVNVRKFAADKKLSTETAARQLRIKKLIEIAQAQNCKIIVTAHQKNDNAETILQRLSRGTGYRGLGGIWPMRIFNDEFRFVRPFLCVNRVQIIHYLQQRNLQWRRDHTNADCTYRRNYIRHRLIPHLQKDCTGSLVEQLSGLSESARRFYRLICHRADEIWPKIAGHKGENVILNIKTLLAQPQPVIIELLRRALTAIGCGEGNLTQYHFEKLVKLAHQSTGGKKINLPDECVVRVEYGSLIFSLLEKKSPSNKLITKSIKLKIPGQTKISDYLIEAAVLQADEKEFNKFKTEKNSSIERFDCNKIKFPLLIRSRKAGDRFVPLGLDRQKKVGKFLTAARVPQQLRQKLLIIADSEKIIWLWPVRTSQQTKITAGTQKVLQLRINKIKES